MKLEDIKTVRDLLDFSASEYGTRTYMKFLDGETLVEKSYQNIRDDSYAISRYIRSISPDRMHVAIIGKTNYAYITSLTGTLISGNVAVPLTPETSAEEAIGLFETADIDMFFYEDEYEETAKEIAKQCPRLKHISNMGSDEAFERIYQKYNDASEYAYLSDVELKPEDCITIMFTSGTTGVRKGAMLTNQSLISNIMYKNLELEFKENDVVLSVLPMHHIFCFSGDFLRTFRDGITVCLSNGLSQMVKSMQYFQPYMMRVVPMICTTLLKKMHALEKRNPDKAPREIADAIFGKRFKVLVSAGAPLPTSLIGEYQRYGITLRQGFGMTETGPRVSISVFNSDYRADSCGRVISIGEVRTVNGELQVKSPSIMLGYYKNPEETKKVFTEDGWFKTGDLGHVTEDGYVYITGRMKNLIILSNGENVSPEDIEKHFADKPLVSEVMAYGENDRIVVEIFPDHAYAEQAGIADVGEELEKLVATVNKQMVSWMEVGKLKIRKTHFPKTTSGKIKRGSRFHATQEA